MSSAERPSGTRRALERPATPLDGVLAVLDYDGRCDWCRGREGGLRAADLEGRWAVLGQAGGTYHVECARSLGWTPTDPEVAWLAFLPLPPRP